MADFVKHRQERNVKLIIVFAVAGVLAFIILAIASLSGNPISGNVALIEVNGPISVYGGASSQSIVEQIENANANNAVKAIVLEINSPGGTVVASEEIARAVEAADKPVISWLREVAASGGYWIAASSDYIIADPATITGSIGVTSSYLEFSGLIEQYGVKYRSIKFGEYKEAGSPYSELTPSERSMLQSKVNLIGEMFVDHVAKARQLPREKIKSLATGEIFLGVEALRQGLVDELGSKAEVVEAVKRLSGIKEASLIEPDGKLAFKELLEEFMSTQLYWMGRGIGDSFAPNLEQKLVMQA